MIAKTIPKIENISKQIKIIANTKKATRHKKMEDKKVLLQPSESITSLTTKVIIPKKIKKYLQNKI